MSIVEELKALITKKGGDSSGVMTISDAIRVLAKMQGGSSTESVEETT